MKKKMIFKIFVIVFFMFWSVVYKSEAAETDVKTLAADSLRLPMSLREQQDAKLRVLVIDGGGIRGVFAAAILQKLEEDTKQRICDLFQGGITGTSTGAFIALALAAPRHKAPNGEWKDGPYSAAEIVKFYQDLGDSIFKCCTVENCMENAFYCPPSTCKKLTQTLWDIFCCFGCCACCKNCGGVCGPRYSNKALQAALEDRFGDHTLGQLLVPVQVVAYNIETNAPAYFRSTVHQTLRMRDVALASSAAPTYFPPVITDGRPCIDGGIFDNSAGFAALRFAVEKYGPEAYAFLGESILLSIGTGSDVKKSLFDKLRRSGIFGWAKDAIDISLTGTSQATDENLEGLLGRKYFRIQVKLHPQEADLDDARQIRSLISRAIDQTPREYKDFLEKEIRTKILRDVLTLLPPRPHEISISPAEDFFSQELVFHSED